MKRIDAVRLFALLGTAAAAAAVPACSSGGGSSSGTSSTSQSGVLRDEYESVSPVPVSGGITQITFYDATTYSLTRTQGPTADELLVQESGTYTLDLAGQTLTLSPYAGTPTTYPFQVVQTTQVTTQRTGLRIQGGLGGLLQGILQFIFGGQTFATDSPPDPTGSSGVVWGDVDGGTASQGDAGTTVTGTDVPPEAGGTACTLPTGDVGECLDIAVCDSLGGTYAPTPGYCPGAANIQCCTGMPGAAGFDASVPLDDASFPVGDASATTDDGGPIFDASADGSGLSCVLVPIEAGAPTPPPVSSGNGVDVSHYQTGISWPTVKSSKSFAYAKATEGTHYTDTKFSANWAGMQSAGISRGAYHFFRASQDPVAQADYFAGVLLAHGFSAGSDLAPMLDVEVTDGASPSTVVAGVRSFLNEAQAKLGVNFIIYTGPSFWTNTLGNPNMSSHPLWIAQYTSAPKPRVPSTWSTWTIWQYSQSVQVNGIASGGVDGDRTNGAATTMPADASVASGPKNKVVCTGGPDASYSDGSIPDAKPPIQGTCNHDVCTAGEALGQACDSCTNAVCTVDPYCCDTYWGASCFTAVLAQCGLTCPI
jgi:GH25 family lysozyme M1 (1,4-beta-N-acetylmuramidase)